KKTRKLTDLKKNYITRWDESLKENNIIGIPLEKGEILTWDHIIEDNNIFKEMDLETDEENDGDNEEKDNMFNDPYVICWGDEVTAEIESGGIKVTATVKSRESGKTGDSILVENINSGKKFNAEIIEPDLVKVKD
ncbi:MAG: flagella basal body P-ring formation protein FlgA, partial [Bacillota bacterium]